MRWRRHVRIVLLGALLACGEACGETDARTPRDVHGETALQIEIGTERFQRIDGFGVNSWTFPRGDDLGWCWRCVEDIHDDLRIDYARIAPWFEWWETINDDDDPATRGEFATDRDFFHERDLPYAEYLADRNVELTFGVWGFGEWLSQEGWIPPARYPEMAESITAYVEAMAREGVRFSVLEVQNEPAIRASTEYRSPEDLRDAARALLRALDDAGFSDVNLHGPNADRPGTTEAWARVWLADETLRDRTAAVSFHTWWDEDEATFRAIAELAAHHDKPVWATETGVCPYVHGCEDGGTLRPDEWSSVMDHAQSYVRALAWANATRVYHWALLGNDGALAPTGERLAMVRLIESVSRTLRPRVQRIEARVDSLPVVAFQQEECIRLFVINDGPTRVLRALPKSVTTISTGAGTTDAQGKFVRLPAQSFADMHSRCP
ncbi:MAG: hypothetical protein AAGE52_26985 [Myxococcota bacterium]